MLSNCIKVIGNLSREAVLVRKTQAELSLQTIFKYFSKRFGCNEKTVLVESIVVFELQYVLALITTKVGFGK